MDLDETKEFLSKCNRWELRDHAFGDAEVGWILDGELVGRGYFSGSHASVSVAVSENDYNFYGDEARALRECGTLVEVNRNDTTGPDIYEEGKIMPGLTKEAVLNEITQPRKEGYGGKET